MPIYVEYLSSGIVFHLDKADGRIPHWVKWISPSEWYVELVGTFQYRSDFLERVHDEVSEFMTLPEVTNSLTKFSQKIRHEHFYKTSELERNPLSTIFTVLERIEVVRILNKKNVSKELFCYQEPLVSYLLLTCFDRLGQPAEWLSFDSWLSSKKHRGEREQILESIGSYKDLNEGCKLLHKEYLELYGVKSSFLRFLKEVLPVTAKNALLDSIEIKKMKNPPSLEHLGYASNNDKEKYLYKRRNDYTHKAAFVPPAGEWLASRYSNVVQEFKETYWTTFITRNWPEVLERTVLIGLASYIKNS